MLRRVDGVSRGFTLVSRKTRSRTPGTSYSGSRGVSVALESVSCSRHGSRRVRRGRRSLRGATRVRGWETSTKGTLRLCVWGVLGLLDTVCRKSIPRDGPGGDTCMLTRPVYFLLKTL